MSAPMSQISPTVLLLSLQILTRIFTFVLNQVLIHFTSPALYGAAHIKFELLLGIILFLSREGIRSALLRQKDSVGASVTKSSDARTELRTTQDDHASNLALLPIPLGIFFASISLPVFTSSRQSLATQPHYNTVVYIYLISALLELISEPLYLHALSSRGGRNLALRVRAEGSAAIAKGVFTLAAVLLLGEQRGLLAFGLGQAAYGATVLLTFAASYIRRFGPKHTLFLYKIVWPRGREVKSTDDTGKLAVLLFLQSILKHLLTEADKIAVSYLATLEDQGGYALGANYASLPLRLLFQPLEESSRFQFSRMLCGIDDGQGKEGIEDVAVLAPTNQVRGQNESQGENKATKQRRSSAYHLLASLLHLHLFLGLFLLAYMPPLSRLFIQILSGSQWSTTSAPRTLAAFALFLPAAGWSGILEGFLQSTANPRELKLYNRAIMASSATFAFVLWCLIRARVSTEEALVYASTVAMTVRALYGWRYATSFFYPSHLLASRSLLPSRGTVFGILMSGVLLRLIAWRGVASSIDQTSSPPLKAYGPLVLTAVSSGMGALGIVWSQDRTSILDALKVLRA